MSLASASSSARETRDTLLQQALVTTVTSLEVLMRELYSIIIDHEHVIYGKSVYRRFYDSTRNQFLGVGSANDKLKRDAGFNLKEELGQADYSYLSKMFSSRHIIVHNCSVKDRDYIGQTNEDHNNMNEPLVLTMSDLQKLICIAKKVGVAADYKLRECLLNHYATKIEVVNKIRDADS